MEREIKSAQGGDGVTILGCVYKKIGCGTPCCGLVEMLGHG